jgi:hypothetical protein
VLGESAGSEGRAEAVTVKPGLQGMRPWGQ